MADWQNDIERYRNGELTPAEMHALEKKALSDPFLADALEGASFIEPHEFSSDMAAIRKAMEGKTVKTIPLWKRMMQVAAGLTILVLSGWILYTYYPPSNEKLAVIETPKAPGPMLSESDSLRVQAPDSIPVDFNTAPQVVQKAEVPAKNNINTRETKADINSEIQTDLLASKESKEEAEPTTTPSSPAIVLNGRVSGIAVQKDMPSLRADTTIGNNKTRAKKPLRTITGIVKDSEDGYIMPGVNVIVKGTTLGTMTDAEGKFELNLDSIPERLQFSFIGFESTEVAPGNKKTLDVIMDPAISELNEVVVVGYASSYDKEETETYMEWAAPDGGKRAYREYLHKNLRYPDVALNNNVEGRVTIQFTVETNGNISDIKVLRGIGFGCDEEVIRLIKSGPKWNPTKKNTVAVPDKVRVRMRFSLPKKK